MNASLCHPTPRDGAAWLAFYEAMLGRQYGPEETRGAWEWFLAGWACSRDL